MGQLYMQRFEHWSAVNKGEFDQVWGVALRTFADTGNWVVLRKASVISRLTARVGAATR